MVIFHCYVKLPEGMSVLVGFSEGRDVARRSPQERRELTSKPLQSTCARRQFFFSECQELPSGKLT